VNGFDSDVGIVALAAAGVALLALLLCLLLAIRLRRVRNEQRHVLGDGKQDLVAHAAELGRQVEAMQVALDGEADRMDGRLGEVEQRLSGAISKTSVVRYDAFNETSGRQSSTVALLDDHGNGVVVTAILQREQARVYAKPIEGGRSALELSPEELEAMELARRERPSE
jgi:hypothetical protein